MRILHVVGARPNFMKIAPVMRAMASYPQEFEQTLIHTGQHYDSGMSQIFFDELDLPEPDMNLEVGSGSHARQTAQVMERFEPVLLDFKPDWVMVPGDVNSTLACALVAVKLGIRVAHVEAGLRSFDRAMPEEINRIVTDHLSDLLFTTEPSGNENLRCEGIDEHKIHFVGNVMIDTLIRLLPKAKLRWAHLNERFELENQYILVTLHRPSNVDNSERLAEIVAALVSIGQKVGVLFPVHPRTKERLVDYRQLLENNQVKIIEPLGYLDFLALQMRALMVLTDSGGIQEETTYLGIPCLTLRANTERPITIIEGTNTLVGDDINKVVLAVDDILSGRQKTVTKPPGFWDGHAAERILHVLRTYKGNIAFN